MTGDVVPTENQISSSRKWSAVVAGAINLIPVIGVLFWGWSAFSLIFLYWLENVVIGVRTLASILANGASGVLNGIGALFIGGFFLVHYGIFCFVHGSFVVGLFGPEALQAATGPFDLVGAARTLLTTEPNLIWGLASIALWQLVLFGLFLARGEWRTATPTGLMSEPYPRIVVLHITIIFGGFLLMMLDEPMAGVVMLALVKAAFDVSEALGRAPFRLSTADDPATECDPPR